MQALSAASARLTALTQTRSTSPSSLIDAAVASMGLAIDGLWRASPSVFVHGAMAWDVGYLGWRSEYGATLFGSPEKVAAEGAYFMAAQNRAPSGLVSKSDATKLLTQEASSSWFYGQGKITWIRSCMTCSPRFFCQRSCTRTWRTTASMRTRTASTNPTSTLGVMKGRFQPTDHD